MDAVHKRTLSHIVQTHPIRAHERGEEHHAQTAPLTQAAADTKAPAIRMRHPWLLPRLHAMHRSAQSPWQGRRTERVSQVPIFQGGTLGVIWSRLRSYCALVPCGF